MENRAEDEIVARWRAEETKNEEGRGQMEDMGRKLWDGEEVLEGGPERVRKRRRLEGATGGSLDTVFELVTRTGNELVETGAGLNARRPPTARKGRYKGTARRVVDLEAEHSG